MSATAGSPYEAAAQWREHQQLRAYLEAMRARIEALEGEDGARAEEWLGCAADYVREVDSLNGQLAMPAKREVAPDELSSRSCGATHPTGRTDTPGEGAG